MKFDDNRTGTGTAEWSERTENIAKGCPNNCLYCYAAANSVRFKQRVRDDWPREELTKKASIKSYPKRDGVIMFPSSHDITPFNLEAYTRVAKMILQAGNKLLIVSKPRLDCIEHLIAELMPWQEQIMFRFTIGSIMADTVKMWEPGAPEPMERMKCLRLAKTCGYQTSVSIEPMLDGADDAICTAHTVEKHVTDTIWIGKMNKPNQRIPAGAIDPMCIKMVEYMQRDEEIMRLYQELKDNSKVRWKDSIKEVISKQKV